MVFGSYRKDDFADPESFLVQLGMILEQYDDPLIEHVTDPRSGIQRTCKFPPSIAEFSEFCAEILRRRSYGAEWEARSRKQLEERKQWEAESNREPLEHRQAVAARILAEFEASKSKPERDYDHAEHLERKQARFDELVDQYRDDGAKL